MDDEKYFFLCVRERKAQATFYLSVVLFKTSKWGSRSHTTPSVLKFHFSPFLRGGGNGDTIHDLLQRVPDWAEV